MYSLYNCNLTPHFLLDFLFKKLHFLFLFEDGDLEADLAASMAGSTVSRNLLRQAMSADNFNGHFKKFRRRKALRRKKLFHFDLYNITQISQIDVSGRLIIRINSYVAMHISVFELHITLIFDN